MLLYLFYHYLKTCMKRFAQLLLIDQTSCFLLYLIGTQEKENNVSRQFIEKSHMNLVFSQPFLILLQYYFVGSFPTKQGAVSTCTVKTIPIRNSFLIGQRNGPKT